MRDTRDTLDRPARSSIAALRKGIEILFLFSEAEPSLSLRDVATRLRLPKSTSHRLAGTLREADVLIQEPVTRRYRLGPRLLGLSTALAGASDLPGLALPLLRDLGRRSGETAHLAERRGDQAVITELVESRYDLRMAPHRGQAYPLHAGALARAILAYLPPAEVARVLRRGRLRRLGPNTAATAAALRARLQDVRVEGVAVSIEEQLAGACGLSAPVLGPDGTAVASIGISGPLPRLPAERRRELARPVREAAAALSALLRLHARRVPPAV